MDTAAALASATVAALVRDYYLWIAIFALVLAFGLYVYLVPRAIDFFENPTEKKDERVRSEPPVDQATAQTVQVGQGPE